MSDMERFIELYKSFGITLEAVREPSDKNGEFTIWFGKGLPMDTKYTNSNKFVGYSGFGTYVVFDSSGNFLNQGFFE